VNFSPIYPSAVYFAGLLLLVPLFAGALFSDRLWTLTAPLPRALRFAAPGVLALPYAMVTLSMHYFQWGWFVLYLVLPTAVAGLLWMSGRMDPAKRGTWVDFAVLAVLGLSIDLRWFEEAWPGGLTVFGKMILLDAAIYGFMLVRRLEGVGFDLDRGAGIPVLCSAGFDPWLRDGILPSASGLSGAAGGVRRGRVHVLVHRDSGRAFLSRMGAESARKPAGTMAGAGHHVRVVRSVALQ
jgi:hypothetical protein